MNIAYSPAMPNRTALVNSVLGKVFHVSRNGLLRPGQTLGELSPDEWGRILNQFNRGFIMQTDPFSGRVSVQPTFATSIADADHPVTAILLQEVRTMRAGLVVVFAELRGVECLSGICLEEVETLCDIVTLQILALERSIAEAPHHNTSIVSDINFVITQIKRLQDVLPGQTEALESAGLGLIAALSRLQCLKQLIDRRALAAPVADTRDLVDRSARCIEEAISDFRETARSFGLDDCDLAVPIAVEKIEIVVAEMLSSLGRGFARIQGLSGHEGRGVLETIIAAAEFEAKRVAPFIGKDLTQQIVVAYALPAVEAQRLAHLLQRLAQRVDLAHRDLKNLNVVPTVSTKAATNTTGFVTKQGPRAAKKGKLNDQDNSNSTAPDDDKEGLPQ